MKNRITAFVLAAFMLLAFASPSFASFGLKKDGVDKGAITDINLKGIGQQATKDGSVLTFNLQILGGGPSGATSMTTSDTAVSTAYSYVKKAIVESDPLYTSGTLADGVNGQQLTIYITVSYGATWTLTPTTAYDFTSIAFDDVGDYVTLLFVDKTNGWVILDRNSVTVNE